MKKRNPTSVVVPTRHITHKCQVTGCREEASTRCEACNKPLCDEHIRLIEGLFTTKSIVYCPTCEEAYYDEQGTIDE